MDRRSVAPRAIEPLASDFFGTEYECRGWTQFGCFSPIMQMHRQVTREMQYPWRFGDQAAANYQVFARLHTQLFPYTYTYAKIASTTGVPIIRPLVLLHQTDPNTFGLRHAYQFGNEFLVAPVIEPDAGGRELYLPAGNWIDFWTHERHAGGHNIFWKNDDRTKMPLFVRDGAVIPMLLTTPDTLCDGNYVNNPKITSPDDGLLFQIAPAGSTGFVVFDGTEIQCNAGQGATTVAINSTARSIALRVLAAAPAKVARDGKELKQFASQQEFDSATDGWHFDPAGVVVSIKFQHPGGQTTISF